MVQHTAHNGTVAVVSVEKASIFQHGFVTFWYGWILSSVTFKMTTKNGFVEYFPKKE
jgi:hypothetical protein